MVSHSSNICLSDKRLCVYCFPVIGIIYCTRRRGYGCCGHCIPRSRSARVVPIDPQLADPRKSNATGTPRANPGTPVVVPIPRANQVAPIMVPIELPIDQSYASMMHSPRAPRARDFQRRPSRLSATPRGPRFNQVVDGSDGMTFNIQVTVVPRPGANVVPRPGATVVPRPGANLRSRASL